VLESGGVTGSEYRDEYELSIDRCCVTDGRGAGSAPSIGTDIGTDIGMDGNDMGDCVADDTAVLKS
jgi:hypothetical protein